MKKFELVFIPGPGIGHLSSTVQIANLLIDRNHRLSITILIINLPSSTNLNTHHESLSTDRIQFITLPQQPLGDGDASKMCPFYKYVIESQKLKVRDTVAKLSTRVVGFVLDMLCSTMIDVANEFRVPSYIFFTSGAGYLSFALHLQKLYDFLDNQIFKQFLHSDIEIPGFTNPIPSKVIPIVFLNEDIDHWLHEITRRFRETKGILVNTFSDLESQVLNSFLKHTTSNSSRFPLVYAVGPILDMNKKNSQTSSSSDDILKWLDEQPPSSVVFLCFGSRGSFDKYQVKEIAQALERSGYRFLWSLRKPPPEGKYESPSEYENIEEVLPEGFLDRTADIGRVIGWAPQTEILEHPATGGFVSHCGWNSTLESLWFGVPIGTWPLYAEQHFNAFEMVVELGLAVEISFDCQKDLHGGNGVIVSEKKIESGIRKLMEGDDEVRKLVKAKSEESKRCMIEGGSSFSSLNCFIDDVIDNAP